MKKKIRVGAVSYLNTKPLVYGFENGRMKDEIELIFDYPSKIADDLINDSIDIGLVPIAVLPTLNECYIISEYGITCNGTVASVCLFSDVPLSEIEEVLLDFQSRTSVNLTKMLADQFWGITPTFLAAEENFINEIKGTKAGVIIGDRALKNLNQFKYVYDLGEEWHKYTGLPFVFAAWVSNKEIPEDFVERFNSAIAYGLDNITDIVDKIDFPFYDLENYFRKNIQYKLTPDAKISLDRFISYLQGH